MKKSRFNESQIMRVLKESQNGMPVAELCRAHGISNATFYSWRFTKKTHKKRSKIQMRTRPSSKLKKWAHCNNLDIKYIQPGNPQQNAYVERFNRTVRYDWLNQDIFGDIEEVQEKATRWLWHYNNERPNMALGGVTPMQKLMMAA